MRKLKLDVEALQVESFDSLPARKGRGTVAAHLNQDYSDWDAGGGGYTVGTCIGPTFCCAETWNCPVIDTNTASRVVSAIESPCMCR
ncbi:hypothetical protein SAMN05216486_11216 [bacterium JGI 053]|nr:hypothetical protein SAMN05216486_11216 [bacterium JGI 053]